MDNVAVRWVELVVPCSSVYLERPRGKRGKENKNRRKRTVLIINNVVVVIDAHIQRIVLAAEETTMTQQVSLRPINCQSRLWSQKGTKVNGSHHGDNPLLRPIGIQIATKSHSDSTSNYVCMITHIARVWINRVRWPTLLVVGWTGKMNFSLSPFTPEHLVVRDGFGSPVPRQPAHLHTQAQSGAYLLRDSSRVPRRRPFISLRPSYVIGSVPNVSSHHAVAYRWR